MKHARIEREEIDEAKPMPLTKSEHKYVELDERNVPLIAGTTMKVVELVEAHLIYGWNPEEIHRQHPYLSMSQIYSALAYYWDRKEELDADMERRFQDAERLRQEAGESPLAKKLRAQGLIQ
ncbi:MAG: DUF433 domain-containing protein [Oscillatoria princeps RMCB-10]|jgi:uncharacterized protein (DUF433 family)|nr:DUF433 domain-containing protein [Oscillatoria princeps RMCB-10]